MKSSSLRIALILLCAGRHVGLAAQQNLSPDAPIACDQCPAWNGAREPFQVFGNTYFVGTSGLSAVLIESTSGLILLDGGLPQSASIIDAHVRHLGFRTEDIRLILTSHAHFDHVGGVAALQRLSHAVVVASAANARVLESGRPAPDDPQAAFGDRLPAVHGARIVRDAEALRLGNVTVTAHLTPGHTPGGTTWSWQSCQSGRCLNIVYADSLNPVSAPGFRFTGDARHKSITASFRRSIDTVRRLPCDILLSVHPDFSNMDEKLARRAQGIDALVDSNACREYADAASQALDRRIAEEQQGGTSNNR